MKCRDNKHCFLILLNVTSVADVRGYCFCSNHRVCDCAVQLHIEISVNVLHYDVHCYDSLTVGY